MAVTELIPMHRPVDQPSPVLPAPRRFPYSAVVIVVYLLIGVVAFWPVYPGISHHLIGVGGDYTSRTNGASDRASQEVEVRPAHAPKPTTDRYRRWTVIPS
jgi:hypothetical protein